MGQHVHTGDLDIWTQQVGEGPDVLLIGGGRSSASSTPSLITTRPTASREITARRSSSPAAET
jgi:hypothetical protein